MQYGRLGPDFVSIIQNREVFLIRKAVIGRFHCNHPTHSARVKQLILSICVSVCRILMCCLQTPWGGKGLVTLGSLLGLASSAWAHTSTQLCLVNRRLCGCLYSEQWCFYIPAVSKSYDCAKAAIRLIPPQVVNWTELSAQSHQTFPSSRVRSGGMQTPMPHPVCMWICLSYVQCWYEHCCGWLICRLIVICWLWQKFAPCENLPLYGIPYSA